MSILRLALLMGGAVAAVFAQSSTGTLTGIVTDPSQARLANVTLKLTNEETGVSLSAVTTSEYTFPLIASQSTHLFSVRGGQRMKRKKDFDCVPMK